ncbi:MAG: hypothetical protein ACOH2S_03505, partial [Janthinobacterium svalbardensis]
MPPTICNAFHLILPSSDSRTSTLPLFYDIAVHAGLGELFAQLGYLGLKLKHGAGGRQSTQVKEQARAIAGNSMK